VTTNVVDLENGIATSDSRWSIPGPAYTVGSKVIHPEFILFADDTGFDKILYHNGFAATFAGNGTLIQRWKNYILSNPSASTPKPPRSETINKQTFSVSIYVAEMATKALVSKMDNPIHVGNVAYFAGTGANAAKDYWKEYKCAREAVETAKQSDERSGGTVKHLAFSDGSNNLESGTSINDVRASLNERGLVMYLGTRSVLTAKQASKKNPLVSKLVEDVASGAIPPTAPCDEMNREWSEREVQSLDNALARMFGW